jgi:hypothetical protein
MMMDYGGGVWWSDELLWSANALLGRPKFGTVSLYTPPCLLVP